MAGGVVDDKAAAANNNDASTTDNNNNQSNISKKRRRMSKRERKNLKKKKLAVATTTTTSSQSSIQQPTNNNSTVTDEAAKETETPTLEEYMINYVPAPLPDNTNTSDNIFEQQLKSLGKWFPKASVIKSSVCYSNDYLAKLAKDRKKKKNKNKVSSADKASSSQVSSKDNNEEEEPRASLVLFYQYVSPPWSQAKVSSFISYLSTIGTQHRTNIGGRIRISTEGVNATVSAASTTSSTTSNDDDNVDLLSLQHHHSTTFFEAAKTLRHFVQDLKNFDPIAFRDTDFKYIDGLTADRHFKELKLLPVKELVFYDIREDDCTTVVAATNTADDGEVKDDDDANNVNEGRVVKKARKKEIKGGIHLKPKEYHEMLKRNDAVVIDVRNHYEAAIGRFDGQMEEEWGNNEY